MVFDVFFLVLDCDVDDLNGMEEIIRVDGFGLFREEKEIKGLYGGEGGGEGLHVVAKVGVTWRYDDEECYGKIVMVVDEMLSQLYGWIKLFHAR